MAKYKMLNSTFLRTTLATGMGAVLLTIVSAGVSLEQAQAATITQTITADLTATNWTKNLTFNLFNTSLGTLNSVSIVMDGSVLGSGSVLNKGTTAISSGTFTLSSRIELFNSTGSQSLGFVKPIFQDTLSSTNKIAAGATKTYGPLTVTDSKTVAYTTNPFLSYFTGTGTSTLQAKSTGASGWTGSSNTTTSFSTSAGANYKIVYDYTAFAVPEPFTMLGAGAAVAFGATFKRRKNSNKG